MDKMHEDFREMKALQSKGIDTSGAVMKALKTAKSTGDLRAGIRRAEETRIPETEFLTFREQLTQMEQADEEKAAAADARRADEKRRADAANAILLKDLERARQENGQVSQSLTQCKADLKKEENQRKQIIQSQENAMKQIIQERDAFEEERNKMQARYSSLTSSVDQKQMENVDLKKQIGQFNAERGQFNAERGQFKEESREGRSQLAVVASQHKQQAEALVTSQSENALLRSHLNKLSEQDSAALGAAQKEVAVLKQKMLRADALNEELAVKSYHLEIKLRKASWSSSNPSPEEFVELARKREFGNNVSRQLATMTSKNAELKTTANEYAVRNEILWKHIPSDKENCVQRDLEASRRRS